jgi:hypothetical protein
MDVVYQADPDGSEGVRLRRTKRKDGRLEDEHRFRFHEARESVVLAPVEPDDSPARYLDPDAIIAEEIRAYLLNAPGATQRRIEESVSGRAADVRRVLGDLVRAGGVFIEDGPRRSRLHFLTNPERYLAPEPPPFGSIEPDEFRLHPRVFGREPWPSDPTE